MIAETNGKIRPPTPAEIPSRILNLEFEASARHRESLMAHREASNRLDRIEGVARKLGWGILAASFGVMVTVVSSALYVGSRFERIEGVAGIVEQHDRRIERLEEKAMRPGE